MFGNNSKRGAAAVAAISTLIADGTRIRGDVHFNGGLHLEGVVEGSISAEGADSVLTISDKGRVVGEIRVANAVVNGNVQGDVFIGERLELAGHARVEGNVHYKVLEMAAGAQVNGKMIYQPDPPRQLSGPSVAAPAVADVVAADA